VADVTPIATAPSSAALRPRRPPTAASAAAIPNHSRELLAALDNRRSGSSREGVGVSATTTYVARSTAPSSQSAVAHGDALSRWPSRRCAAASAMLRRGLRGSDDMRMILGRPGGALGFGQGISTARRESLFRQISEAEHSWRRRTGSTPSRRCRFRHEATSAACTVLQEPAPTEGVVKDVHCKRGTGSDSRS
jgi:hypothetical protein